jgi:hypothetical protein
LIYLPNIEDTPRIEPGAVRTSTSEATLLVVLINEVPYFALTSTFQRMLETLTPGILSLKICYYKWRRGRYAIVEYRTHHDASMAR